MEGERRIEFLRAEAQRLREELKRIDDEVLQLCGKDGHDQSEGREKEPKMKRR